MGGGARVTKYPPRGDTNWITRSSDESIVGYDTVKGAILGAVMGVAIIVAFLAYICVH